MLTGSDTKTLLQCEKTCRSFRDVIAQDKTWAHVPVLDALVKALPPHILNTVEPLPLSFFKSRRDYASVTNAIRRSWLEQVDSTNNILLVVFGAAGWEAFIQDDPSLCTPEHHHICEFLEGFAGIDMESNRFVFRRDTLDSLAEIVQDTMLRVFQQAHSVSCTVASVTGTYPVMTREVFCHGTTAGFIKNLLPTDDEFIAATLASFSVAVRDDIIRRLSLRAGIVRMDNAVYELAWATFVHIILLLIRPGCMEMVAANQRAQDVEEKKRLLAINESIRTVPPLTMTAVCTACLDVGHIHTIVPQQVEDAAKKLGLVHVVYGESWLLNGGCERCEDHWEKTRDSLIAKAEEDYEFEEEEEDDVEEEEDLHMEYYSCLCTCAAAMEEDDSSEEQDTDSDGGDSEDEMESSYETASENETGDAVGDDALVGEFEAMDMLD